MSGYKQKLRMSIKHNRFYYPYGDLTVQPRPILESENNSIDAILVSDGVEMQFKSSLQYMLVGGLNGFSRLLRVASCKKDSECATKVQRLCLDIQIDQKPMIARKIVTCEQPCNNFANLHLSEFKFLDVI